MKVSSYNSITSVNRDSWNACFTKVLENYDYLLATEKAGIPDFSWRYITVTDDAEKIIAASFFFIAEYNLETTLQGLAKKFVLGTRKLLPNFLKFKLACFGSPVSENCYFGFVEELNENEKLQATQLIFQEFERVAVKEKIKLLGIKDVPEADKPLLDNVPAAKKYKSIISMPSASLKIDFKNIDEYFAKLSHATRKDIRRKLKKLSELRIEKKTNIDDIIDILHEMYLDTRSRSDWQFETLTKDYFRGILSIMPHNSFCNVYYSTNDKRPLAANLFLFSNEILLDKYFCARAEDARNYNIYFISWIENIKYCLENRIERYDAGQAGYENKIRLGCALSMNWLYFRHRNPALNAMLRLAAPLLAEDLTLKPLEDKKTKDEK